jgi:hypothetical protein
MLRGGEDSLKSIDFFPLTLTQSVVDSTDFSDSLGDYFCCVRLGGWGTKREEGPPIGIGEPSRKT